MWRIARWIESNFSLLRSKIRELHPVHWASLQTLLRHLSLVSAHSAKNGMTAKKLAEKFYYPVLRGNESVQDDVSTQARCISSSQCNFVFKRILPKELVMEDLIQNAHTLFEERRFSSPSAFSLRVSVAGALSAVTHGASSQSPEAPRPTEPQTPSTLPGLSLLQTPTEDVETAEDTQGARGTSKAVEVLSNNAPQGDVSPLPTSVAEWRLQVHQPEARPQPALTIPQSPTGSVLSSSLDFLRSSATSLQTREPYSQ